MQVSAEVASFTTSERNSVAKKQSRKSFRTEHFILKAMTHSFLFSGTSISLQTPFIAENETLSSFLSP